ncbi:MAG TPA: type I-C CRISPR-associated protein Cas8c/Csd1 [Candidatus Sumerlaeota bacterium]|nr:type I-C CRISPR-associated protein Cas8c/Csd1 [Candidatus Sumerlaeota bacterium]
MILQALYKLAEHEQLIEDPDFEQRPIRFQVTVGPGGKFLGIQATNSPPTTEEVKGKKPKKSKPQAKTFRVPLDAKYKARTSGAYAGPLFDKADYVFGIVIDPKDQTDKGRARALERRDLFRSRVAEAYAATNDEGVGAVLAFLESVAAGNVPTLQEDTGPGDLFAFFYSPDVDLIVTDRPAVQAWWKQQRSKPASDGPQLQCLVSGEQFSDPDLFPKIKRVPGVQGDISLVSFNQSAFLSYGLDSNENAPVSRNSAEAIATALNRLLHPAFPVSSQSSRTLPPRSFRISDDTAFCYWSTGSSELENVLPWLMEANPAEVKSEVWTRLWNGRPPAQERVDLSPFYGLIITGQTGRAILRGWFETTIQDAQVNMAQHFADLKIVRNAPWKQGEEAPPAIPLRTLLESIAAQGKQENIPSAVAGDVIRAALTGCLYPMSLLTRAVERTRAEIGADEWSDLQRRDARAALIKAVLNRKYRKNPSDQFKEVRDTMDAGNTHPGYILGALMAVLERLQQEALGDVNASVVDKHFSGASAAPRATFDRLVRNARHHAKKAADGEKAGFIFNLERLIDALLIRINVNDREDVKKGRPIGFPITLPIEEQGLFVIGYHHMRHWLWMNREDREAWENANATAPSAFLWLTRKNRSAAPAQN